ncbi:MAG TPA: prolyl oligopeptidase family serine peptidase [Kofleriaceae bacterium]|nr:prolyl oligopeptidase family serine peptidase [Kofleriaceae bacterium]
MRIALACLLGAACGGSSPPASATLPIEPPKPLAAAQQMPPPAPPPPAKPWPATRTVDVVDTLHGKTVRDPYRWLEDDKSDEVKAWMTAQDTYTRGELGKLPERDQLAARLKELFYFDAIGAPAHRGTRFFYTRKLAQKEKTIVYWKEGEHGAEQVLFDPNTWSEDGSKGLHGWFPSWDGKHVAYAVSEHNSDETVMHVRDVATGKDLHEEIAGTKYAAASWTPDGRAFYYTWVPPVEGAVTIADRPGLAELRYHVLGTDPAKDPVVHEATHDAGTFLGGGISREGRWLFAVVQHGWNSTDVYFQDVHAKKPVWQTLVAGVSAVFEVDDLHDVFYVKTNDGAPRYRVFAVDPKHPARDAWKEIVPESPDATLQTMTIVGGHLALEYLRNAASELEIHALDGKLAHKIEIPALGTVAGVTGRADEDTAYISYSSFTEPQLIYKASVKTGKVDEWARVKLPIDTSNFVTEQVFYPSKDGTKISMFILHRKDAKQDGSAPTILYGYGGFNVSLTPSFAGSRVVWLEHGGNYAIPNLRGGGEYGEDWHKAGMGVHKQNVFDDFEAAAEYLVAQKWTSRDHLAIYGGSNGGLLVGTAVTQRPELFKAVICAVPLLDMLRYHLFGSGKTWVPEYGSAEDAEQFAALWAYSPYRRAIDEGARKYPAVLFDSADHDDRVDPLHARKLAAALQALQTADAPILLRIERNSGHGGADMVKSQVERVSDQFAFLLQQLR